MRVSILTTIVSCGLISACGSDSSESNSSSLLPQSVPTISALDSSVAPLKKASKSELEQYLKQGVYVAYHQTNNDKSSICCESTSLSTSDSGTNQQHQGVNEADRVKSNDTHLYVLGNADVYYEDANAPHHFVRVLEKQPDNSLSQVNEIPVAQEYQHKSDMYLEGEVLINVSSSVGGVIKADGTKLENDQLYADVTQITFTDIKTPKETTTLASYKVDGLLVETRVIGDTLYVINRHHLQYSGFKAAESDADALRNYQSIYSSTIESLLPKISDDNNASELINPGNCLIASDVEQSDGYNYLTSITAFSLSAPSEYETACVSSNTAGIYMSDDALYLYAYQFEERDEDQTFITLWNPKEVAIHKFEVDALDIEYQASTAIEGNLGHQSESMARLRFDEHQDTLRVVTSQFNTEKGNVHKLFVLEENGDKLETIATLPNEANPTPIGKLNKDGTVSEDIYAVRYYGDQAFIVTYEHTDPLYVLDLSNKAEPVLKGALEMPGYSSYLHKISDHLLLGVGSGLPEVHIPELAEGTLVRIFDISDLSQPVIASELHFPNTYSALEHDYKAISVKETESAFKFTLPLEAWQGATAENESGIEPLLWSPDYKLMSFEVEKSSASLSHGNHAFVDLSGKAVDSKLSGFGANDRGVIATSGFYYVHGNYVWFQSWAESSQQIGPF